MQEAQIEELEAQLQNTKADLKNAQRRIETLHSALKGHEAYSDEDSRDDTMGDFDDDDLSSNASSYKVGEIDDLSIDDISDTEGSGLLDQSPPTRTRTWERRSQERNRDVTPKITEEGELYDEDDDTYSRRRRRISNDSGDVKLTKYDKRDKDDDYIPRNRSKDYLKDTGDDDVPRRGSRDYLKDLDEEIKPKTNISDSKLEETPRKSRTLERVVDKSESDQKLSSLRRGREAGLDDEDDDDDDLEEFLLKQRERTRRLQEEDNFEPISVRSKHSKSPSREDHDPKLNGRDKAMSREGSEVSLGKGDSQSAKQRRKNRRRRTIEQELSSPEHQAAKANGAT